VVRKGNLKKLEHLHSYSLFPLQNGGLVKGGKAVEIKSQEMRRAGKLRRGNFNEEF